jgi:hypothetical protein
MTFREFRDKAIWPTLCSSAAFVITNFIVETRHTSWNPTPRNVAPLWINFILYATGWTAFVLGMLTFPRWYSIAAFLSLIWVLFVITGR